MAGLAVFPACQPSGGQAQMSPSEKLFKSKCRSCHSLPKLGSRSVEEWRTELAKHDKRIELTAEQKELILKHLSRSPEPITAETK